MNPPTYSNNTVTRARLPIVAHETLDLSFVASAAPPALKAIGIQIVGNDYSDGAWFGENGYATILKEWNPAYVNLIGAGQYQQARQRSEWIKRDMPRTRRLWRHMIDATPASNGRPSDGGMWLHSPVWFRDNIIVKYDYHHTGDYIVTDNEAAFNRKAGQTWYAYAEAQAKVIDLCVPLGTRLAVCRFPTHWPTAEQLDDGELDELFEAVGRNMDDFDNPLVIISPNAYEDDEDNDGLLNISRIEARFVYVNGFWPVVCLGEYGYDKGITSEGGWRSVGMDAGANIDRMVDQFKRYLSPWAACGWCAGVGSDKKVANFLIDRMDLKTLGAKSPEWTPRPPIPPMEEAPVEIAWIDATLEAGTQPNGEPAGIFVRPTPGAAEWVARVEDGEPIAYKPEPVKSATRNGKTYKWLQVKTQHDVEGWMALVQPGATPEKPGAQFVPRVVTPPAPVPEPPPPPPDETPNDAPATIHDVDKLRTDMLAHTKAQYDALFAKITQLEARVNAYERILNAHKLSIESELKLVG